MSFKRTHSWFEGGNDEGYRRTVSVLFGVLVAVSAVALLTGTAAAATSGTSSAAVATNVSDDAQSIPGTIEAEAYENTSSERVGWVESGDWWEYTIEVDESGMYDVSAVVASGQSGGAFTVAIDGQNVSDAVTFDATDGWTDYTNVSAGSVSLSEGTHTVRLTAAEAGWTVDKLRIQVDEDDCRSIEIGETVDCRIDEDDPEAGEYGGHYEPVTLNGTEGQTIRITLDAGYSDLKLVAPNGTVVRDPTATFVETIKYHTLSESGEYTIIAGSNSPGELGDYTVSLTLLGDQTDESGS